MTDHRHEAFEVYDVAARTHSHDDLESLIQGLREDLSRAEQRIRDLEEMVPAVPR